MGLKLFWILWNLLKMKKSEGFHIIMLIFNLSEFGFWVEFLTGVGRFTLEDTFSFNWDLCGEYL